MHNERLAYERLCRRILKDFEGEITGEDVEVLEDGTHPEKRFLVGTLSPHNDEDERVDGSSVMVHSIGMDILLREDEVDTAVLRVTLRGDLFYRVRPTLAQQRAAFVKEVASRKLTSAQTFEEMSASIDDAIRAIQIPLLPVYKKFKLEELLSRPVEIHLKSFYIAEEHTGSLRDDPANEEIRKALDKKSAELGDRPDAYRKSNEPVHFSDLIGEASWFAYEKRASGDGVERQGWSLQVTCDAQAMLDGLVRVSLKLNNDCKFQKVRAGAKSKMDKERIVDLFNAGMIVSAEGASIQPIEMEYFLDDYKYDRRQYALGANCAVETDDHGKTLRTTLIPCYEQHRLKTVNTPSAEFEGLISNPSAVLRRIHAAMLAELKSWRDDLNARRSKLTPNGIRQFGEEIDGFELEANRFLAGIELIEREYIILRAFQLMNRAFQASSKGYSSWRLFQIVFIVSLIPDIAACDPELLSPGEKSATALKKMDLLYFPTGGGKTEAFLGIMVFNLFFDRLRGKRNGVTAILKYPLRLLSVQQVQRVANILATSEILRRELVPSERGEPFSIGYYVGDNNTPNSLKPEAVEKIRQKKDLLNEEYRVVDICPFCGNKSVDVIYDEETNRLLHHCSTEKCPSGGTLPVLIVDYDIYHYLPSVVISTLDKIASAGQQRRFRNLFGNVHVKCPVHGYHPLGACDEKGCTLESVDVEFYDPAPSLFIQDELHLVRESLGTYDSHFESFLQYYVENLSPSERPVKIIGATATISSYREQVNHLYLRDPIRFPCRSPYPDRNFYAKEDANDLHRLIAGYIPFGRAIINSVVYSLKAMRLCAYKYLKDPQKVRDATNLEMSDAEAFRLALDYWIMLEYNNVKVDGNNVINALDDPINTELEYCQETREASFSVRKMTGDDTFQDVRRTLAEVENYRYSSDAFNTIVATSMISHGVDADRFNTMFFFGIPGNTAEYIQAYSRVGRKYPGIVIDIIRPTREREISYFRNFVKSHQYKDILVDPVPLNRWASRAIQQTLPCLFSALVLNYYTYVLEEKREKVYMMDALKKAVEKGWIRKDEVLGHLYQIYGCGVEGMEIGRGNQYREQIRRLVDFIFEQIDSQVYDKNTFITAGLEQMGLPVMRSLRDTDKQVTVELK